MPQWLRDIPQVVVGDLVATKPALVDVQATTTIAEALVLLRKRNILSVPVYGKKGGWIGSGGVELIVGDKQYIGIASIVDILAYVFHHQDQPFTTRLATPINQVLGSTDESLCLWVEPSDRPLLYACEMLGKGVHRALVPGQGTCRLLTQTDIVKFLVTHSSALPHLQSVFKKTVGTVARAASADFTDKLISVNISSSLQAAVTTLLSHHVTAVPVMDDDGNICTQLSISDFRGVIGTSLALVQPMTVEEFLLQAHDGAFQAPIVCRETDTVSDAVQIMLMSKVHRIWVERGTKKRPTLMTFTDVIAATFLGSYNDFFLMYDY